MFANASTGAPVAGFGKSPADPAISKWLYFSGMESPDPCSSSPEAKMRKAPGPKKQFTYYSKMRIWWNNLPWWPLAVLEEGKLLHWRISSPRAWPLWKERSSLRMVDISNGSLISSPFSFKLSACFAFLAGPLSKTEKKTVAFRNQMNGLVIL